MLKSPHPLHKWFHRTETPVAHYYQKTKQLIRWNNRWKREARFPLVEHSEISNVNQHCLILAVDDSAWASQLHYMRYEILSYLRNWSELKTLRYVKGYVIKPTRYMPPTSEPSQPRLSASTQHLLQSVAKTLKHPGLQAVFRALSQNT